MLVDRFESQQIDQIYLLRFEAKIKIDEIHEITNFESLFFEFVDNRDSRSILFDTHP